MIRAFSIVSISPAGSIIGTSTSVPPRASETLAHPDPPMWNSGIATSDTEVSSTSQCVGDVEQRRAVVVGQHHALGQPGRAGGVELQHHIVVGASRPGSTSDAAASQASIVLADPNDAGEAAAPPPR